ncbi:hypothetical protein, partial [uncultured Cohaesibacter sp.]|uniref:hypothetical protein n=1 Tax=uncultured Cohaesibacter sp. TaxID=1002546 RepID=UPI0029C6C65C
MLWDLVADVGGTNMRLAAAVEGRIKEQHTFDTTGTMHLTDAVKSFVGKIGSAPRQGRRCGRRGDRKWLC